ncbi:MAG TPA: PEP-CTERM sorting domain-containing protein [Roseiarcus sp.]|nr:PEP-CTERM sorting domain-containing protein [Roseiarcus sp.]
MAALALFAASAAKADVATRFDVSGTFADVTPPTSSPVTLAGTMDVDVANGAVTAIDLVVTGFPSTGQVLATFDRIISLSFDDADNGVSLESSNGEAEPLVVDFLAPAVGTLVRFDGSAIVGGSVGLGLNEQLAGLTGSITPAPVPEPSTWAMMLLGFVGLAFAGYRRTWRNRAGQWARTA